MLEVFNLFRSRNARSVLETHRARLYRIAYAWTRSPALADDLVQETLTKALVKSGQLRDPKASEAWLYSILSNCYRDHFRRLRETEDVDTIELLSDANPEQESSQQQLIEKVRAAMMRLPEGQRQVVSLVDIEGFSYVEVAEILAVPIGTVMSRLCRARASLKEQLLPELRSQADAGEPKLRRVK